MYPALNRITSMNKLYLIKKFNKAALKVNLLTNNKKIMKDQELKV